MSKLLRQCWCGANPDLTANGDEVDVGECDFDCAGTSTGEKCGGYNRISVYMNAVGIDSDLTYIGCYEDRRNPRAMGAGGSLSSSSMTNKVRKWHRLFYVTMLSLEAGSLGTMVAFFEESGNDDDEAAMRARIPRKMSDTQKTRRVSVPRKCPAPC